MISEIVFNITFGIVADLIYEGGMGFFQSIILKFRLRAIKKWINKYVSDHDGTVITSGSFEGFISNYHPLEKIIKNISEGNDNKTKEELINEIIACFEKVQIGKCTVEARVDLKDFLSRYYDKISLIYERLLSPAEKYSNAKIERATIQAMNEVVESGTKNTDQIMEGVDDIRNLLSNNATIDNPNLIFKTLVNIALGGNITAVNSLLPLIKGKNKDLEIAVPLLISIVKGNDSWLTEYSDAELSIVDDKIYTSIAYIAVYMACFNDNMDGLNLIGGRCENVRKIAQCIVTKNYEELFSLEKRDSEGFSLLNVRLNDTYSEDLWLTSRVCMKYLLGEKYFIDEENLKTILIEPHSVIDDVVLAERIATQTFAKTNTTTAELEALYDKYEKLRSRANEVDKTFKARLYALLLRLSVSLSTEKAKDFLSTIPKDIRSFGDIELLAELINVNEGDVDFDRIMGLCMKRGEYWLFADSIIQIIENNPEAARAAIEKYIFVIDADPYCFLAYLWSLSACRDIDELKSVISNYETKYNNLYEYWIEKIKVTESEIDIENAIEKSAKRELQFLTKTGLNDWISLLNDHRKYEEINKEIESIERTDQITNNLLYYKGIALSCTNQELEALNAFKALFEQGNHSNAVVYHILMLAIKNSRNVEDEILICAEKSGHPELLMAAAEYRKRSGEKELAIRNAKKALLRSDNHSRAYGVYIGIALGDENEEEKDLSRCDVNTVVSLKTQNQKELVVAIHEKEILPEDNYLWHGAKHIDAGTAIDYDLFRKTVGEDVEFAGEKYQIEKIESLDTFLARICFEVMVGNGSAKTITLQTDNSGKPDVQSLAESIKNLFGENNIINDWANQYKDPTQIPMPFASWAKISRAQPFQVVEAIYDDDKFIYREINSNTKSTDKDYLLSYSALCILRKLGWNNNMEMKNNVIVPAVLKNVINFETDKVKRDYNKEHVASLGVNDGNVIFIEEDEESKRKTIGEANRLKMYCDEFKTIENTSDIRIINHQDLDLKDILGIADYEALVTAKYNNLTLVSAEVPLTAMATVEEVSTDVVCIVDFLVASINNDEVLLDYIYKLVEHRFALAITDLLVDRLLSSYIKADKELKERLLRKWEEILRLPLEDKEYKFMLASAISENVLQKEKHREDFLNPVIQILIEYVYKYIGLTFNIGVGENGEIYLQTFRTGEA